MTTQIRSPEPRGRSTRPRQVAAELDREQATTGAPQPSARQAPRAQARPTGAALQPADERELSVADETAWEIRSSRVGREDQGLG